jgi:uncharacterized protein with von Willebrand factor type A (vWA) domain
LKPPQRRTDISKAVEAASRDAEMRKLRGYTLAVVTDLEDEKLNMEVIKRAKGIFREVVFIVVGTARPLQGVKSIRLTPPPLATLFFNTPQI